MENTPMGRRQNGKKAANTEASPWTLVVRNDARKKQSTAADFSFLPAWLGEQQAQLFLEALQRVNRRYASATPAYGLRIILMFWARRCEANGLSSPTPTSNPKDLLLTMSNLRHQFYLDQHASGRMLSTTTNKWSHFIPFVRELIAVKAIPRVAYDSSLIAPPPANVVRIRREDALDGRVPAALEPKSFNRESDSYNDELLEDISLVHSDEEYLSEYQGRLSHAMETIQKCALGEIVELERMRAEGRRLIEATDYEALKREFSSRPGSRGMRYRDPTTGVHLFDEDEAHPNLLGNLLSLVHHEMDGIPKQYDKTLSVDGKLTTITVHKGRFHWKYVEWFGKTRLLSYLGVMTSPAAVACIVLLMIEHPRLNATSLLRAELEDKQGQQILLLPADRGSTEATRMVVKKPRAGEEKDVLLTPLSQRVMDFVMEWTSPVRAAMREAGDFEAARKLWVGMHIIDYRLLSFSEKALTNGLRMSESNNSWGARANKNRVVPFVRRHPELKRWEAKLTLKALRVSGGVLVYLRTDGDLVATARAFGHKNIKTTISHYVPAQLRLALYERQVRRHQNLLLAAAAESVERALAWTDFQSTEELHQFLASVFKNLNAQDIDTNPIAQAVQRYLSHNVGQDVQVADERVGPGQLILSRDPQALGVAILYREHLRPASNSYLDTPDIATKVRPRFWCDFIDCISGELPHALQEVRELVAAARKVAATDAQKFNFPKVK